MHDSEISLLRSDVAETRPFRSSQPRGNDFGFEKWISATTLCPFGANRLSKYLVCTSPRKETHAPNTGRCIVALWRPGVCIELPARPRPGTNDQYSFERECLITQAVNEGNLVTLPGNVRPETIAQNDRGAVADGFAMDHLLLQLRRAPEQETALSDTWMRCKIPRRLTSTNGSRRSSSVSSLAWRNKTRHDHAMARVARIQRKSGVSEPDGDRFFRNSGPGEASVSHGDP